MKFTFFYAASLRRLHLKEKFSPFGQYLDIVSGIFFYLFLVILYNKLLLRSNHPYLHLCVQPRKREKKNLHLDARDFFVVILSNKPLFFYSCPGYDDTEKLNHC